jgi:putative SOS response-associated peptidase YedK
MRRIDCLARLRGASGNQRASALSPAAAARTGSRNNTQGRPEEPVLSASNSSATVREGPIWALERKQGYEAGVLFHSRQRMPRALRKKRCLVLCMSAFFEFQKTG